MLCGDPGISGFQPRFPAFKSPCGLLSRLSTDPFSASVCQSQPLLLTTKTPKRISFYGNVFPYVLTRQASGRVPTQIDRRRLTKGASWTSRPSL